jgi:hypothetical protein
MASKEAIYELYNTHSITYNRTDSYDALSNRIKDDTLLTLSDIRKLLRKEWVPAPIDFHLKTLRSGILQGHSWHGARPSMLHMSLQEKVRDFIKNQNDISGLIAIGSDIVKHEYFMVAIHDMCESSIIQKFTDTIPSIRGRSISDFVFQDMPYDLKITTSVGGRTRQQIMSDKQTTVKELIKGADSQRIRKQADKTHKNWGLNRFYIIIENQDRWLIEPEAVIQEVLQECSRINDPVEVGVEGVDIWAQIIAV